MASGDLASIPGLIAELDGPVDGEHPDVAISDESGWTLSAFQNGLVVWENVEEDEDPRHMAGISRAEVKRIMLLVAEGDLDQVDGLDWEPGYR